MIKKKSQRPLPAKRKTAFFGRKEKVIKEEKILQFFQKALPNRGSFDKIEKRKPKIRMKNPYL